MWKMKARKCPEHQSESLKDHSKDPREQEMVWGGRRGLGENIRAYGPIRTPLLDLSPRYQWDSQTEKCTDNTGLGLKTHAWAGGILWGVSRRMDF